MPLYATRPLALIGYTLLEIVVDIGKSGPQHAMALHESAEGSNPLIISKTTCNADEDTLIEVIRSIGKETKEEALNRGQFKWHIHLFDVERKVGRTRGCEIFA